MLSARSAPFSALLDADINTTSIGIMTGKLRIDMMVLLLPVLALIADTIVNMHAKPTAPNTIVRK